MTGQAWAFLIFQFHVLGPTSWASAWAAVDGRGHGAEPLALLDWRMGYLAHFFIPISCPPSPCVRTAWARAVIISATVAISTCLLGCGLIKPDRRHTCFVNDGLLGFALVFHTSLILPCFLSTSPVLSSFGVLPSFLFSVFVLRFLLDFHLSI